MESEAVLWSNIVRLLHLCKGQKVKEGQKSWFALWRSIMRLRVLGKWYVCLGVTTCGSPSSAKRAASPGMQVTVMPLRCVAWESGMDCV